MIVTFSSIQVAKVFCCDDTLAEEAQKRRNAADAAQLKQEQADSVDDENFKNVK